MYEGDVKVVGTVVATAFAEAKTGTLQLAIGFEFVDPETQQADGLTWYGYMSSDEAFEIMMKALRALRWDPNDLEFEKLNLFEGSPLVGRQARLVLGWEEYQGERRRKVKFVNEMGGLAVRERLPETQAKGVADEMRRRLTGKSSARPAPTPAPRPGATAATRPAAARPAPRPAAPRPAAQAPAQAATAVEEGAAPEVAPDPRKCNAPAQGGRPCALDPGHEGRHDDIPF